MNLRPFTQSPSHFFQSNQNIKGPLLHPTTWLHCFNILNFGPPPTATSLFFGNLIGAGQQSSATNFQEYLHASTPILTVPGSSKEFGICKCVSSVIIWSLGWKMWSCWVSFNDSTSISNDAKPAFQIFSAHTPNCLPGHGQTQSPPCQFPFWYRIEKVAWEW